MQRRESGSDWRESSETDAERESRDGRASAGSRRRTHSIATFFAAPTTVALVRSTFVLTRAAGGTWALRARGRVARESIDELVEVLDALCEHDARRQLFDLRGIDSYTTDAMSALMDFYEHHPRYRTSVAREAVIRPSGLVGVFAEGFFRTIEVPFPAIVVTEEREALEFLGEEPEALAIEGFDLEEDGQAVAWRVREVVTRLGASARVAQVARELGASERSLQRLLASAGTSFRQLRSEALADEIDRLRELGTESLKEIAARLEFGSAARLTELYRSVRGRAPTHVS